MLDVVCLLCQNHSHVIGWKESDYVLDVKLYTLSQSLLFLCRSAVRF